LSAGKLLFTHEQNGDYAFPIQVIGTQTTENPSWLWAWANTGSPISKKLLKSATQTQKYGEKHKILELTTAEVPLSRLNGHFFAIVASGICKADAYFAAPYDRGAAFLLVDWGKLRNYPVSPLARATFTIPRGISTVPIPDHRLAIREYLSVLGLVAQEQSDALIVQVTDTPVLRIDFDEHGRMVKFTALVGDLNTPLTPNLRSGLPTLD
jgi:hypothetical protein